MLRPCEERRAGVGPGEDQPSPGDQCLCFNRSASESSPEPRPQPPMASPTLRSEIDLCPTFARTHAPEYFQPSFSGSRGDLCRCSSSRTTQADRRSIYFYNCDLCAPPPRHCRTRTPRRSNCHSQSSNCRLIVALAANRSYLRPQRGCRFFLFRMPPICFLQFDGDWSIQRRVSARVNRKHPTIIRRKGGRNQVVNNSPAPTPSAPAIRSIFTKLTFFSPRSMAPR